MAEARYTLIEYDGHAGTNAIVLPDLDVTDASPGLTLSGHDSLTCTVPVTDRVTEDGQIIIHRWRSGIVVQRDDDIFGVYLVTDVEETGEALKLTLVGVTGYPADQPYRGVRVCNQDDCATVFRHLWTHLQAFPGANLGVTVAPYTSRGKVGYVPRTKTTSLQAAQDAYDKAAAAKDQAAKARQAIEAKAKTDKKIDIAASRAAVESAKAAKDAAYAAWKAAVQAKKPAATIASLKKTYDSKAAAYSAATARYTKDSAVIGATYTRAIAQATTTYQRFVQALTAAKAALDQAKATVAREKEQNTAWNEAMEAAGWEEYRLAYYDDVDLAGKADELASLGRFDYVARHEWVGDTIVSTIVLTDDDERRENPGRFVVGENVVEAPTVQLASSGYATDVFATGSGEGDSTLWVASTHDRAPGLARVARLRDKRITARTVLQARADEAASRARDTYRIAQVVTDDHPNAPHGTVHRGDLIWVQGDGTNESPVIDRWVRVVGISWDPTTDRMTYDVTP